MVGLWSASSLIRSIQYVSVASTTAAESVTIAAVNVANTAVIALGPSSAYTAGNSPSTCFATVNLVNSTTVTLAVSATGGASSTRKAVVIEFAPGVVKSIQSGSATINTSTASATATITGVDTAKTWITMSTLTNSDAGSVSGDWCATSTLTNATTITFTRQTSPASYNITCRFFAVEYF